MSSPTRRRIGGYEVAHELGRGGMGVVYLAHHAVLDRPAVIKTLRRDVAENDEVAERFAREAQAAAAIHHQNVVGVYDCFAWRGESFIVQEYVDGVDLAAALRACGRLDPGIALRVGLELARGLEEIHARGVVHRDLKPGNILLGRSGETKIGDFGIALDPSSRSLTQTGVAVGTPTHMAPEQHRGERADPRSDLFAFGVLLFEMLTGELPYPPGSDEEAPPLGRRMESGRHPPVRALASGTPRTLARLVQACLRPRPRRRPADAAVVRRVLERLAGSPSPLECREEIAAWLWQRGVFEPAADDTVRLTSERRSARRPRRALAWVAAAAAAALAMGGVGAIRLGLIPPPPAVPAALRLLAGDATPATGEPRETAAPAERRPRSAPP